MFFEPRHDVSFRLPNIKQIAICAVHSDTTLDFNLKGILSLKTNKLLIRKVVRKMTFRQTCEYASLNKDTRRFCKMLDCLPWNGKIIMIFFFGAILMNNISFRRTKKFTKPKIINFFPDCHAIVHTTLSLHRLSKVMWLNFGILKPKRAGKEAKGQLFIFKSIPGILVIAIHALFILWMAP